MSDTNKSKLSGRAFVSVMTALAFIGLLVTGPVLFVTPPGRVANWTGWRLFGLTKDQWSALHIWFSLSFVIASGFHIYLNWRPLFGYFKSRLTHHFAFRWEWALALALCAGVCAGTLVGLRPFSSFVAWHESIKQSWDREEERAPIPHAELLTLRELAAQENLDPETMITNLNATNIFVDSPDVIVGELAETYGMTPQQLHRTALGETGGRGGGGRGWGQVRGAGSRGGGSGRKTLEQFCADEGLDLADAVETLRIAGIEAEGTMVMHDIAGEIGLRPPDLVDMLRK